MQVDVQNTTVLSADGSSVKLGEYSGEVILVVNVASYCGITAQYEELQKLHDLYSSKGLSKSGNPISSAFFSKSSNSKI